MKLAILGLVAAAVGVAIGQAGLIGIGAYWVVLGPFVRAHGQRLKDSRGADGKPTVDGRTFAIGTALFAALGIPSLLVGILEIGFDADHAAWRWVPLAVGIYAVLFGGVGALLFGLGSALEKAPGGSPATVPATLRIVSVRETGTFINERPRLEFVFAVEPDAGTGVAGYEVTKKATTPFTAMSSLRVGDGFRATVAGPEDPTSMDIRWDEPVAGPASGGGDVDARLDALEELKRDGKVTESEYAEQRARILGTL